jgi:hypothetical protein
MGDIAGSHDVTEESHALTRIRRSFCGKLLESLRVGVTFFYGMLYIGNYSYLKFGDYFSLILALSHGDYLRNSCYDCALYR